MAQFDLYIDVLNQQLVSGLSGQNVNLPGLYQDDVPTFRIFLLYPTGNLTTPYSFIGTSGLSLQVAIGQKKGTGGIVYTQQLTWAPSTDPNNPNYWIATIPLNTTPINTGLGSNPTLTDGYFQVVYLQNGVQSTVLEVNCTINASVIQGGAVVVPPGLTPVSLEYVNANFLTRTIVGGFTMVNPNTNKKIFVYLGDDSTFHADPLN